MAQVPGSATRRELLGTVGSVATTALAGCGVCASSVRVYDDLLRLTVRDFREAGGKYHGTLRVRHRGPDDWDEPGERENFPTTYEGVTVYGYTGNGREVLSIDVGKMAPGTIKQRQFTSGSIPVVLIADPDEVTYDQDCVHADVGSKIGIYLGEYSVPPDEVWQPEADRPDVQWPNVNGRNRLGDLVDEFQATDSSHLWLGFEEYRAGSTPPPSDDLFRQAWCVQRLVAGRDQEPPPDFSAVQNAEMWLERDEEIGFDIYRTTGGAPKTDRYKIASRVPERIRRLFEETDWYDRKDLSVSRSVDLEEWKRLVSIMKTGEEPEQPPCDGNVFCRDNYRKQGHCRRGWHDEYYSFEASNRSDQPVAVNFYYHWEGLGP